MTLSEALEADRQGQIEQAATRYELLLSEGPPTLVVLLNLAVLYWQATDPGLAAAKRLTPEFLARASSRFPELLTEAERSFPRNAEARFWRRYIRWADLGEPFSREECQQLLREDPSTLVPVR